MGIRRTSAYSSSPTDTVEADQERPAGDARSVRTQGSGGADKVRRSSQPQYRELYPTMPYAPAGRCRRAMSDGHCTACQTCQSINSIVGAVVCRTRRTLYSLPDASEHKQYCRRRCLPYQANTVEPARRVWALTVLWALAAISYPTAWATRLGSTCMHCLSFSLTCKAIPFTYKRGCALSQ